MQCDPREPLPTSLKIGHLLLGPLEQLGVELVGEGVLQLRPVGHFATLNGQLLFGRHHEPADVLVAVVNKLLVEKYPGLAGAICHLAEQTRFLVEVESDVRPWPPRDLETGHRDVAYLAPS